MNFVLFDDEKRGQLFPFTHTRPAAMLRIGILTIQEKWEQMLQGKASLATVPYLMEVYNPTKMWHPVQINGRLLPSSFLVQAILNLQPGQALVTSTSILAIHRATDVETFDITDKDSAHYQPVLFTHPVQWIDHPWDIFSRNEAQLLIDFELVTAGRSSEALPDYVTALHPENIFIEPGAILNPCIINATNAKIYIGKDAEIMEGCMLRGSIAICDHAVLKMGAKVYGGTTIGPGCKVGGEVQNVVFYANSNKGHDGYLGNAVIGEWCNLGADTNCSNLKNDYRMVDVYSESEGQYIDSGLQFCGLLMGDHSKCSINSMFNTGTVVGVSCNIFGTEFPPKFIPSFTWGGSQAAVPYRIDKAMDAANRMMGRRSLSLSQAEEAMFAFIYKETQQK